MNPSTAGSSASAASEKTVMIVWPSIAMYPSGQWLGRLFEIKWPDIYIFRLGNLLALLAIPHALFLFFCRLGPKTAIRYRLTNRRIVIERGMANIAERSIAFDDFDQIKVDVQPGQAWYPAGDLVFLHQGIEVFRLEGVSRPEPFRQTCIKTHQAYQSVAEVRRHQSVA